MKTNSILIEGVNTEQFTELIVFIIQRELKYFQKEILSQSEDDDLLSRQQVLELLQINASTLWHWQRKKRITVYKFANKCYYKRSEIMASLTPLNK